MRNSPPRAYLLLRQSLNETGAAGRPNVPPLRRTTDLSEGRREGQLPIPSGSSGHLPLIRGGGLPYGSRENLPGLGRGAPWGSRADVVHVKKSPSSVWPIGQPPSPCQEEGLGNTSIRTGSVGSAKPGAEDEPQRHQFLQTQGPVAWRGFRHPLKFCAPEMTQ